MALSPAGPNLRFTCTSVEQRNWSRVAFGVAVDGGSTQELFLKQFIDRGGRPLSPQYESELIAHPLATAVLGGVAAVPGVLAVNGPALTIGYEPVAMTPMDTLLRSDPSRFTREFPGMLETVEAVLTALAGVGRQQLDPAVIEGQSDGVLTFKGLDFRNLGVGTRTDGASAGPFIFDFGKAYLAPIADAAARYLVSIALLNWGRPLGRFARGPNPELIEAASRVLGRFTSLEAVLYRLQQEAAYREAEIQSGSLVEHLGKVAGIKALGGRYTAATQRLFRRALA